MIEFAERRCGNCAFLEVETMSDIGGLKISKCVNQYGANIDGTIIYNDWVELGAVCDRHMARG